MKIKLGYRGDSIEPLKRLLENREVEFVLISKEGMELMDEFYFDYADENLIPTDALAEHVAWLAYYDEIKTFKPAVHYITDFRDQYEKEAKKEVRNISEEVEKMVKEVAEEVKEELDATDRRARFKYRTITL